MSNEIKISATYHVTREELSKNSKSDILKYATENLSKILSHSIVSKADIFSREETDDGIRFMADCYVLTPKDFSELVEKIQKDLMHFGPTAPMIGGAYP